SNRIQSAGQSVAVSFLLNGILDDRINLRSLLGHGPVFFTPAVNGNHARTDRNYNERYHHVLENWRSRLPDDPSPVVDGKRALDQKARESTRPDITEEFISGIFERRRSPHNCSKRKWRGHEGCHHERPPGPLLHLLLNIAQVL